MTFRPQVLPDAATARQIIDAGVRALALKLHPDLGESHEAMTAMNTCADQLRRLFPTPKPERKLRPETVLRHSIRNFLRREAPNSRSWRQMNQADAWGAWVGDGVAEEWLQGPMHPIYRFHFGRENAFLAYDLGAPVS